ncbi:MAG: dihydrodipicolinate synthase family protein [Woeseiaceae bacterium]
MAVEPLRGVIVPMLTPFDGDASIAHDLYVRHARWLFEQGSAGIAPFGTTGEALSVGVDERIVALEGLVDAGIDPQRMIPGTGMSNVADTARMSRACLDLGCAGVMTLPPFYYKRVTEEGLFRYFTQLVSAIGADARIYLYHIPQVAIVGISPSLASRLHVAFPGNVVGIKDSSGDWENTQKLFDIDGMIVYPGSEVPLLDALELGGPGCISATANLNAQAIADVVKLYAAGDIAGAREKHERVISFRRAIELYGPIPAQKHLLAMASGDDRWAGVRPPLEALPAGDGQKLIETLSREFGDILEGYPS